MNRLQTYLSFVRFSHSVFALPFALTGALLALRAHPAPPRDVAWRVLWIVVAMVAARTAAMGFNRLVDARWDAKNPRTAMREIPRGAMTRQEATILVIVASLAFVGAAYPLGTRLLRIVAGRARRSSSGTRSQSGSPATPSSFSRWRWRSRRSAAGWPRAARSAPIEPWLLGAAIGAWVGGFDILYACQDLEFDRAAGLKSIPVRFGVRTSLLISRVMHVVAVACLAALGAVADLGPLYLAGVAIVAVLLVYEQSLVSEHDLSQVKRAFDLNGYVGILYFAATAVSIYVR